MLQKLPVGKQFLLVESRDREQLADRLRESGDFMVEEGTVGSGDS